jgi:hypothetical protein
MLFDNKSVTENNKSFDVGQCGLVVGCIDYEVMSKRTLQRAPPMALTVMYGDPGTSTIAGGVMFSFGHA